MRRDVITVKNFFYSKVFFIFSSLSLLGLSGCKFTGGDKLLITPPQNDAIVTEDPPTISVQAATKSAISVTLTLTYSSNVVSAKIVTPNAAEPEDEITLDSLEQPGPQSITLNFLTPATSYQSTVTVKTASGAEAKQTISYMTLPPPSCTLSAIANSSTTVTLNLSYSSNVVEANIATTGAGGARQVSYSPDGQAGPKSFQISSLSPAMSYQSTATVKNAAGDLSTCTVNYTTLLPPSCNLSAVANSSSTVTLAFDYSSDAVSAVISTPGATQNNLSYPSLSHSPKSVSLSGLSPTAFYTSKATVTNAAGEQSICKVTYTALPLPTCSLSAVATSTSSISLALSYSDNVASVVLDTPAAPAGEKSLSYSSLPQPGPKQIALTALSPLASYTTTATVTSVTGDVAVCTVSYATSTLVPTCSISAVPSSSTSAQLALTYSSNVVSAKLSTPNVSDDQKTLSFPSVNVPGPTQAVLNFLSPATTYTTTAVVTSATGDQATCMVSFSTLSTPTCSISALPKNANTVELSMSYSLNAASATLQTPLASDAQKNLTFPSLSKPGPKTITLNALTPGTAYTSTGTVTNDSGDQATCMVSFSTPLPQTCTLNATVNSPSSVSLNLIYGVDIVRADVSTPNAPVAQRNLSFNPVIQPGPTAISLSGLSPATSYTTTATVKTALGDNITCEANYTTPVLLSNPVIRSINPSLGPQSGGTELIIIGKDFRTGAIVTVGDTACLSMTIISSTQISCITPAHTSGTYDIVVANIDGQSDTFANSFYFVPKPTITSITPLIGGTAGGTTISIAGTGFSNPPTSVLIGTANCGSLSVSAPGILLSCVVPAHDPGAVSVKITNQDTQSDVFASQFQYLAPPTLVSIDTTVGPPDGGTTITITGTEFSSGILAYLIDENTIPCRSTDRLSVFTIQCVTPAHPSGSVSIKVVNLAGDSAQLDDVFYFTAQPAPTFTSMTPAISYLAGGNQTTITGTNFDSFAYVRLGGTNCPVVSRSATSLTCVIPAHVEGLVDVFIRNGDTQTVNPANVFTYTSVLPPIITSVSPNAGPLAGNTAVTVNGSGFQQASIVKLAGVDCPIVGSVNPQGTQFQCTLPPARGYPGSPVSGPVNALITNPDTQSSTFTNFYTYQPLPTLTSITPLSGAIIGGTSVTLAGTGFVSGLSVRIGGSLCNVTSQTATQVVCSTTYHAPGSGKVIVTNADGQGTDPNTSVSYKYQQAPIITQILPSQGSTSGGSSVTLLGSGFYTGMVVKVGGINCGSLQLDPNPKYAFYRATCVPAPHSKGFVNAVATNLDKQTTTTPNAYYYGAKLLTSAALFASNPAPAGLYDSPPQVNSPTGIAVDSTDPSNPIVYVSDTGNFAIRKYNVTRSTMETVGGAVGYPGCTDGGLNTNRLSSPQGIAFDPNAKVLYIVDQGCQTIRVLDPSTMILTTIAGNVGNTGNADGVGSGATFNYPLGVAISSNGSTLYVTDYSNQSIRKLVVDPLQFASGATVSTLVHDATHFSGPSGITLTPDNTKLFVADFVQSTLLSVNPSTGVVTLVAGQPNQKGSADNGVGLNARFTQPLGVYANANYLYVSDFSQHSIRQIAHTNAQMPVATVAGGVSYGHQNGPGNTSQFWSPELLAGDNNSLYIADNENHAIRNILFNANYDVSTVFGGGTSNTGGLVNGSGSAVLMRQATSLASDGKKLFFGDYFNCTIRWADPNNGQVNTLLNSDCNVVGYPKGIATDGAYLFISDDLNHVIRQVDLVTLVTTVIAGKSGTADYTEGTVGNSAFNSPSGIYLDGPYLYVADSLNHVVRRIDRTTTDYTTSLFAGTARTAGLTPGASGQGLLNNPTAITAGTGNVFYIATSGNYQSGASCAVLSADTAGTLTLFAGSGTCGHLDGTGTNARISQVSSITSDGSYVYVASALGNTISKIDRSTSLVNALIGRSAVQGQAYNYSATDQDGPLGNVALTYAPFAVAFSQGSLFFSNKYNIRVIK